MIKPIFGVKMYCLYFMSPHGLPLTNLESRLCLGLDSLKLYIKICEILNQ